MYAPPNSEMSGLTAPPNSVASLTPLTSSLTRSRSNRSFSNVPSTRRSSMRTYHTVNDDSMSNVGYGTPEGSLRYQTEDMQHQVKELQTNVQNQNNLLLKMQIQTNVNFKNNQETHQEFEEQINTLQQKIKNASRNNYVLLGFNINTGGAREPIFAASVNQAFDRHSLAALGASTSSAHPFYFVYRQLLHLTSSSPRTINLYEINQFSHFCEHDLTILVPMKTITSGDTQNKQKPADERKRETLLHSIARTNRRLVIYTNTGVGSPTPPVIMPVTAEPIIGLDVVPIPPSIQSTPFSEDSETPHVGGKNKTRRRNMGFVYF